MYWLKEDSTWFEESMVQNSLGTFCFSDQLDSCLQKGFGFMALLQCNFPYGLRYLTVVGQQTDWQRQGCHFWRLAHFVT
jgi:hypothetical protein